MKKSNNITRRWFINNIGLISVVLLAVLLAVSVLIRSFYYNSARQHLSAKMNMVSSILQNSYNDSAAAFTGEVRSVVEGWEDRNTTELMVLNGKGEVCITSSGFVPTYTDEMTDFIQARQNNSGYYVGKLSSGEKIMAMSVALPQNEADYSVIRVMSSLDELDFQLVTLIVILAAVCIAIILLLFFSGMYFIKSIVMPVRQIGATARRYAEGDFSVRIKKKNDDEIGELCDTINHMAAELANSENMKNEFISSVSHELRTPLTAIKGWAETISLMPDDTAAISKGMHVIVSETERLSQMVEELLDFSRIQNGRFTMNKETMDVLAELGDAVLIYTERAKKDHIDVVYDEPDMLPFINGDKNRIRQVFINVIDNAIKYSDKGGIVSIKASMPDASHIKIDVSDTGCGISKQDLPKIKNKFYKANYTRRGSGIGLAVADEIITIHGGSLNVFSEEGVGTTVVIVLPVEQK